MDALVFYACGILAVLAALLVVTRKNPVYSTIYLVFFFTMVSLQFLILEAPFLAVVQVLVYAGAIMVLFLFVIMLLNLTPEELRENVPPARKLLAAAGSTLLFILLAAAIRSSSSVRAAGDLSVRVTAPEDAAAAGEASAIGRSLFAKHALAFEFSTILILIAITGAIYLTKKRQPGAAGKEPKPAAGKGLEAAGREPLAAAAVKEAGP